MKTGHMHPVHVVKDRIYLQHLEGIRHPESPERLEALYQLLSEQGQRIPVSFIEPRDASQDELALIHDPDYIREIAGISQFPTYLDPDTPVTRHSFQAAIRAAGGLLAGVDALMAGSASSVLALVRPPGHHAEKDQAMGFCLFNNIAIAARYAQERHGIGRILICDWDVHHGNGTQNAFYGNPSILYFSIHQYPHYPGTGRAEETGAGSGRGFTINCPLPPGQGDQEYRAIFQEILEPVASSFKPELVLVSAGFDAYFADPLARMQVTEEGFAFMTRGLMRIASAYCQGRTMLSLEGGYDLHGLVKCVGRVLHTLAGGVQQGREATVTLDNIQEGTRCTIARVRSIHCAYWKELS